MQDTQAGDNNTRDKQAAEKPKSGKKSVSIKDEAEEAIFQTKINDEDVELYILGTWNTSITGSIGYDLSSGSFIETPFEQMEPGFVFRQIPDLTVSLWLMDRYFFEATIKEDSEQNTFLLGYEGKEDEFVQSVLIGNTKIDIDDYSFLTISSIPDNSLGASAAFKTERTWHELMLRYDPSEMAVKEFIGKNEVARQVFMPTDYYRGKVFVLPDEAFDMIEVYIEDEGGSFTASDSRKYRKAENTDVIVSSTDGTVTFRKQAESRVLVYYEKNGKPVGDVSIGKGALCAVDADGTPVPSGGSVDFSWDAVYWDAVYGTALDEIMAGRKITLNGKEMLLIYNRGEYSPFESLSYYKSSVKLPADRSRINLGISAKSSDPDVIEKKISFRVIQEENLLYIYANSDGPRDMHNRYPLTADFSGVPVYGPARNTIPGSYRKEVRLETMTPVDSFFLDPDIVPGSVTVKRNGFVESMYDIDYQSGIITFRTYIHPNDRIKVTYKTSYLDTEGGDLLFATGNRFLMGDFVTAELAFGIKWNVLSNQYSRYPGQYKGSLLGTGGVEYTRENLKMGLDTGISVTSPDTTGILRLFDMQQSGITMRLGNSYIFPSSIPDPALDWGGASPAVTRDNRGKLIFKDYYSYTLGGATLNNYNWNVPSSQVYEYKTGNPPGPYTAKASNDGIQGEILVMDLDVPDGRWAGSQVPLRKFSDKQDLSDAQAISFKIKCENVTGGKLYVQIGTISEDLDGDGILDRESSKYSEGFSFNDPANNAVLLVGGIGGTSTRGNGSVDSEDNDLNGVLDLEDPGNVLTLDIDLLSGITALSDMSADGRWYKANHVFSLQERKKLSQTSSVRFVYVNESGDTETGRILIGELFIESSPFSATVSAPGTAYAKEVYERFSSGESAPSKKLVDAYPEVKDIFFKNFDITSTQKVLESGWDGSGYTLTGYSDPVPFDMYRKLSGYISIPELENPTPAEFTISYTDTSERGIKAVFQTGPFTEWKKFEIDLERKKIYLAGEEISGTVKVSSTDLGLTMLKIESNAEKGKLFLDEIHLTDPEISLSGAVAANYEHHFPGTVLSWNGRDIIRDLTVSEYFLHARKDFSTDLSENSDANNTRTKTSLKTGIFDSRLETNLDFSWIEPEFYSVVDHNFSSPLGTDFLTFTDSYSENKDSWSLSFAKRNEIKANIGENSQIDSSAESRLLYSDLSQKWDIRFTSGNPDSVQGTAKLGFLKISSGYVPEDSWYMENWLRSFTLLVPEDTDPWPDRSIVSENSISFKNSSNGFDVILNAGTWSSGENSDRRQKSTGKTELRFPFFREGFGGWKITPGYSREFSYTNRSADGSGYLDDTQLWLDDFSRQSYYFTGIPFVEFFSEDFEDDFREKSSYLSESRYTPLVFLNFSRQRSSSLADLFAPSDLGLKYSKDFLREEDTISHIFRISADYTARAINLFGTTGLLPLFSFYRTDEFVTRLSFSASSTDTPVPQDRELGLGNSLYFSGNRENELIIDNRFRYVYSHDDDESYFYDNASVAYTWIIRPSERIYVKHLAEEDDDPAYFSHTESLAYSTAPETLMESSNYWSLLLTHESALIFPEKGSFKALLSVGLEKHNINDSGDKSSLYLLGLQAGIFGRVMF